MKTESIHVRATLINEMLGTAAADPAKHLPFVAGKSGDEAKIAEEMAALPTLTAEEKIQLSLTTHYRDEQGNPMIWDYMVRGFLKAALFAQVEFGPIVFGKKKIKISKYNNKRVIDNQVFVFPRKLSFKMPENSEIKHVTRPLRAETMKGERVALATSEAVPAGTTVDFEIRSFEPELLPMIRDCLEYGQYKGLGQWRNSGCGTFSYEELKKS